MLGAFGERGWHMLRNLFALVSGLFAMMIVITFIELANAKFVFPPPAGIDWENSEAVAAFARSMPTTALALVLLGWLVGATIGASVTARLAGSRKLWLALVVGLLVSAGVVHSALTIPHPTWMVVAGIALPPLLAWLAALRVQKGLASTR